MKTLLIQPQDTVYQVVDQLLLKLSKSIISNANDNNNSKANTNTKQNNDDNNNNNNSGDGNYSVDDYVLGVETNGQFTPLSWGDCLNEVIVGLGNQSYQLLLKKSVKVTTNDIK